MCKILHSGIILPILPKPEFGTRTEVKEEAKRCLNQGKPRPGGFILMPACEWPPMSPPENLDAVREALMEYGFY